MGINDILFLFLWLDTKGFSPSEDTRIIFSGNDAVTIKECVCFCLLRLMIILFLCLWLDTKGFSPSEDTPSISSGHDAFTIKECVCFCCVLRLMIYSFCFLCLDTKRFSTNSTRAYHREAMHLQQRRLKAFQQHLIFEWAKITPSIHPSTYFSPSKNVFSASLSLLPTLSVCYNRWSRNREL